MKKDCTPYHHRHCCTGTDGEDYDGSGNEYAQGGEENSEYVYNSDGEYQNAGGSDGEYETMDGGNREGQTATRATNLAAYLVGAAALATVVGAMMYRNRVSCEEPSIDGPTRLNSLHCSYE